MTDTQFDLAYITQSEQDFIRFIDICSQITRYSVSGHIAPVDQKIRHNKKSTSIPVFFIHPKKLPQKEAGERLHELKRQGIPYIVLYDDDSMHELETLQPAYWLHVKQLNAFYLGLLLPRIESDYRLRVQTGYLKRKFHESEKRFIGIFRSKTEAVIVLNTDGLIRYINPACEEQFGISRQFVGQQFPYPVKAGDIRELELTPLTGKNDIAEAVVSELIWEDELCLTVTLNDTKEIRRLETEILTFRHVIHLSPLPIMITDHNGVIIYVNEQFSKATGYSRDEVLGQTPRILKSNTHEPEFYKGIWDTILSGKTWSGEICNKSKDGRLYWEKQVISPVKDRNGELKFFVAIRTEDVEKQKAEMKRQREEMLKSVQELAGGIAHEFSQPLQVLSISMSMIEKQLADCEYYTRAQHSIQRIVELVDNLKSITTLRQQDYLSTKIINIRASSQKALKKSRENRILVIDDERELLDSLTEVLELSGYYCDGVSDGFAALEKMTDTQYGMIICDVDMPNMPGTEFFLKAREAGYKGYFVFMTGYEVEEDLEEVVKQADAFLAKPFPLDKLKQLVQKMIGAPDKKKNPST
ncbi:MAG: PAS domain S-box protein [Calditrichaeota bacterium]|nr:MAG: PAS domain S-box protein [Calditrichota bacterium]